MKLEDMNKDIEKKMDRMEKEVVISKKTKILNFLSDYIVIKWYIGLAAILIFFVYVAYKYFVG
tara:strand:+ start:628 stop:816 length:189 start_codon:yes stop_codon:yes gene_type:complete